MNHIIENDLNEITSSTDISFARNTKWLISGVYGMLASYLTWELIFLNEEKGFNIEIYGIGRNKEKAEKMFGNYCKRPYFHLLQQSVTDVVNIGDISIDYVVHAASPASPQFYKDHPISVIEPNTIGTSNLLKFAVSHKTKAFLFYSSCEVYGSLDREVVDENDKGVVDPQGLRNCYAIGKICGENLCRDYSQEFGLRTLCIRPGHTFGPTMDVENDERVFSSFLKNAILGEPIALKSDGSASRYFCYISDATKAAFVLLSKGVTGAYNMTNTKNEISIKNLAYLISSLPKKHITVSFEKQQDSYMRSPMIKSPKFLSDKLISLGWTPSVTLEDGFSRTFEYLSETFHKN